MNNEKVIESLAKEIQALCKELPLMTRLQINTRLRRMRIRSARMADIADVEPPVKGKTSQKEMILEYLRLGHSITPLEALKFFGCFRLSARIADIRKAGFEVHTEQIHDRITGKRYASYSLIQES
ncbi:MAG: hypothetical protein IK076_00130 [Bacteroidales bacterium]|nr:hypothetical protein [Bacteroidales bacterium]